MSEGKGKRVDLNAVSDKFTEEVLAGILAEVCKSEGEVRLIDWSFDEGFAKGDYFTSSINKGSVSGVVGGKLGQRRRVQANFVVKAMPKNPRRRKTMRSADFFRNEIVFYTEVASRFKKFLADKGQSHLLSIPRYLASFTDGENDFLVLEDASRLGFGPASRRSCLDLTECTVILKTMAKFHAISFAHKDQREEEFAEIVSHLREIFFGKDYWDGFKNYHKNLLDVARHALNSEYPGSEAERCFNSYRFGALYDKCAELCGRKNAPTSVVCEGDCWPPNFLVRDVGGAGLKEALMLDFQISRCASPVTDLSFLIYSCTDKTFRDQHFDDMLKIYHSELSDGVKSLGSDPERVYPWNLFLKEVKEQFFFGLFASLEIIPLSLLEVSPSIDLDDKFLDDEDVDLSEAVKFFNIETASGRRRLADMIVHAVDCGFLPYADNFQASSKT
ncbi:PREDICTED: uncharacterized protein LOC106748726 [Dinoponera quadriceps]|uniref:Uncharacterized protein LOC106748726 n=1 Tax=Dinoponera quadriceps TaxID=609295 RepID=A0A6P3XYH1_DINQU|nr:PREDICTED: uncharacterized protein LOC106748726 [Dinoponera quadriceps]